MGPNLQQLAEMVTEEWEVPIEAETEHSFFMVVGVPDKVRYLLEFFESESGTLGMIMYLTPVKILPIQEVLLLEKRLRGLTPRKIRLGFDRACEQFYISRATRPSRVFADIREVVMSFWSLESVLNQISMSGLWDDNLLRLVSTPEGYVNPN